MVSTLYVPVSHLYVCFGEMSIQVHIPFFSHTFWSLMVQMVKKKKKIYLRAGGPDLIPGLGRSSGEENGYPLQYSCLQNSMDRGAWKLQSIGLEGVEHDWLSLWFLLWSCMSLLYILDINPLSNIMFSDIFSCLLCFLFILLMNSLAVQKLLFHLVLSQFSHSVVSDSLRPQGLQHARLPCPSLSPGTWSNSCPSSQWCHPTISSSVVTFSTCLQSCPALLLFFLLRSRVDIVQLVYFYFCCLELWCQIWETY